MERDARKIYKFAIGPKSKYEEEKHCISILNLMLTKGRLTAFCAEHMIGEDTFYRWVNTHPNFAKCYSLGKIYARESWEIEGEALREETNPPGVISHKFEHWKLIGWSRFGVSKNGRVKLNLDPKDNPSQHYAQLLYQAANGDFTAAEIKQLMEAVNVGLNTHQVFELQKEIDQLKSDLAIMMNNTNGNNTSAVKGITKED